MEEELESRLTAESLVLLGGSISEKLIAFVTVLVFARLLDPDQYGVLVLGVTVVTTASLVGKLGLPDGIARNLPKMESTREKSDLVSSAYIISLFISCLLAVGLYLASNFISVSVLEEPQLVPVLKIFSLVVPLLTLQSLIISTFRGFYSGQENVIINNILFPLAKLVLVSAALFGGYGLVGVTFAWIGGVVFSLLITIYLLSVRTSISVGIPQEYMFKMLLVFSLPLLVSSASELLLMKSDTLLIGYFMTSDYVGFYQIGWVLGNAISIPLGAFGYLLVPMISGLESTEEHKQTSDAYNLVTRWSTLLTYPLFGVFIVFPKTIIRNLFGSAFTPSASVLSLLATGFFFHVLAGPVSKPLIAFGHTRLVMTLTAVNSLLNIVLNFILIPEFGILGASIASVISYSLINSGFAYVIYTKYNLYGVSWPLTQFVLLMGITLLLSKFIVSQVGASLIVVCLFIILFGGITLITYSQIVDYGNTDQDIIISLVREIS